MGRTSILMILVFNMTFMFMGFRLSTAASAAYQKYRAYADVEQAGLALESAANIAISNSLLTPSPTKDTTLCLADTLAGAIFKIRRIPVTTNGAADGDSLYLTGSYAITWGNPLLDPAGGITCTTSVRTRGNSFSQFVFYSESEQIGSPLAPIYWGTGEVCRGRLHTQDNLWTNGSADFQGKVTTKGNVISSGATPNFEKGHTKADISIPNDLTALKNLGKTSNGGKIYNKVDTYVEFLASGQVVVRAAPVGTPSADVWAYTSATTGNVSGSTGPPVPKCTTYASISALTSSGVFLVQNADLHVKGTLNGKITLGSVDTLNNSGINSGLSKVWIDDQLTYHTPPPSTKAPNPTVPCTDMLGIVATNNIMVSEYINHDNSTRTVNHNTVNNGTPLANVTINASMFSQLGGFGAEDAKTRASSGTLSIVGGLQQHQRNIVGQGNGTNGFLKDYDFDNDLNSGSPVGYPKTPFVVQAWVDYTNIKDLWSLWN